jgi:hypothetical protein
MSVESIRKHALYSSEGVTAATHSSSGVLGVVEREAALHNRGDGLYRAITMHYDVRLMLGRHIGG